jgi:hypothetical protein
VNIDGILTLFAFHLLLLVLSARKDSRLMTVRTRVARSFDFSMVGRKLYSLEKLGMLRLFKNRSVELNGLSFLILRQYITSEKKLIREETSPITNALNCGYLTDAIR